MLGQRRGADCGPPESFAEFDDLVAAFRRQLALQIQVLTKAAAGKDRSYREFLPAPYVAALMDDCIESAKDITNGGARYDFTSIDVRGLATLTDSLCAIRTFVYDKKALSLADLVRICLDDFKGEEILRRRLLNEPPKYGDGCNQADETALAVLEWIYEEAAKYRNIRGGKFRVCYYSYGNHVIDGLMLGATPDGRRKGEPISNGVSPGDLFKPRSGATGPMKTVAKFPPHQVSSGIALNMRFHPSFIRTDSGLAAFASMIRTYFDMGGMHVQPNVVSTEVLRDAQRNPEKYHDLVVKVSGYSAYFTDLGRSIQEDIIARFEFGAA
jgi:formate C-acetyltransferase